MGSKSLRSYQRKVKKYYNNTLFIATHDSGSSAILNENPEIHNPSSGTCSSNFSVNHRRVTSYRNGYINNSENLLNFSESGVQELVSNINKPDFQEQLRQWAVKNKITQSSVSELLKLLRNQGSYFETLPLDARTLVRTPKNTSIREIGGGRYAHIGLKKGLKHLLKLHGIPRSGSLILQINVDGIPLTNSTSLQLWPILCKVENIRDSKPFPIAIFCGEEKPSSSNEYLEEFVNEALKLCEEGLSVSGENINVTIKSFICDAPARAFLLNVKGHTGYFGCGKCEQEGDFINNRMVFLEVDSPLRTNESFRDQRQPEHHHGRCELERLPVDLVRDVPYEFMHLVCLGVVRKFLFQWTKGKCGPQRLRARKVHELSTILIGFQKSTPSEFGRKPRGLTFLNRWKAKEFRTFVLYTGAVALKHILPASYYQHFLVLHVAIYILCSPILKRRYSDYAGQLLKFFVQNFSRLYGQDQVSYNVHGLIHLERDSQVHGPLDDWSAFPFENCLGQTKTKLRSYYKPLEQLLRRHHEENSILSRTEPKEFPELQQIDSTGAIHLPEYTYRVIFTVARFKNFVVKCDDRDSFVKLNDGRIVKVHGFFCVGENKIAICSSGIQCGEVYTYPCNSSLLGIRKLKFPVSPRFEVDLSNISRKVFAILEQNLVYSCIPFVNSVEE